MKDQLIIRYFDGTMQDYNLTAYGVGLIVPYITARTFSKDTTTELKTSRDTSHTFEDEATHITN